MEEFLRIAFGEFTLIELIAYAWFFVIGYIIYGLNETTGRDIMKKNTPVKWSWWFWFHDNWRRYLTTVLCSYVLFRFYNEISGHPFGYFDAITLGLIGDGIAASIKERVKGLMPNREKLMIKLNENEGGV